KAGCCRSLPISDRGRELILKDGADRRLEACSDLQRRNDGLVRAGIWCGCEQHPERLGFGFEPGQPGLDLARSLDRGLLYYLPASRFLLVRGDRSATRLDPLFGRDED